MFRSSCLCFFLHISGHFSAKNGCFSMFCPQLMPTNCSAAKQLPQFCKHSKSADLLRKSLLSHVWRVPSSKALSCKHERLFDLLTLVSSSYTAKNGSCIRSSDDNANRGTEPALFIVISAFDRSCDHTLDDLSAECKVQNHDRRHRQQHCCHLLRII